jgi:hypothetical protein
MAKTTAELNQRKMRVVSGTFHQMAATLSRVRSQQRKFESWRAAALACFVV